MTNSQTFDESYDVVVAGFGLGGGISALTAAQAGAKTLLIEKSPVPGGLSICSYGAVRSARDPELAFTYLKATNDGRTPDDVLRVLANGMCGLEEYVRELGRINNAAIMNSVEENAEREKSGDPYRRQIRANYPLPGTDTFYHTTVMDIPGVDLRRELDNETFAEIHQALLDHLVIFFRDQDIDFEQHQRFAQYFGKLHIHVGGEGTASSTVPDYPAIRKITREAAANDYRWSALTLAIVKSAPFQMRKTKEGE